MKKLDSFKGRNLIWKLKNLISILKSSNLLNRLCDKRRLKSQMKFCLQGEHQLIAEKDPMIHGQETSLNLIIYMRMLNEGIND